MERVIKTSPVRRKNPGLMAGMKDGLPIFIGYIPISITFGMIAVQGGFNLWQTLLMSALVFAGASQFMAVNMVVMGASSVEIVIATFILNLRHFILNLSIMNEWQHMPKKWRSLLSFGITDETYSVLTMKEKKVKPEPYYMTGLIGMAYCSWLLGTALGGIFSNFIPPLISLGMSITLYAMFIGLLVPEMKKSWKVTAIALASILLSALLHQYVSNGWSIIVATLLGSSLGIILFKGEAVGEEKGG